jgi:hypothetical protein
VLKGEGGGGGIQSTGNYLCIKKLKRIFSRAVEAHLLNNDDSSSFSTTIEGT